jgi:autotransporter translocation and assembly factor TamB
MPMRTAIRYLRRAVGIILLMVFFSVFALVIVSRTSLVNELLRDKVTAFIDANYRGTLRIARVEGSIWGSLRLQQVALLYQGKTIASIPQLSLEYSLFPLLWRTVHLRISAYSPLVDAQRQTDGKWNLLEAVSERVPAAPTSARRTLTIDVDSLEVSNGVLQIMPSGGPGPKYRATNLDLDTAVRLPSSGLAVDLRRLTANLAGPKLPPLYVAVSLTFDDVVPPAAVKLTDLDLRTQRSTLSIAGSARLARTPSVNLKLIARRLAAADIAVIYPASQLKADVQGTIKLQGPENALHSVIALTSAGATLNGSADANLTQRAPPYAVKLELSNANLQKISRTNGVAGVFDATIESKGVGPDIGKTTAELHLRGHNLKVKQYRLGMLDLTVGAANKNAHLIFTLTPPAGYLTARAQTTISSDPSYHLELAGQRLDLANAGAQAKLQHTDLNFGAVIDGHGLSPARANTGIRVRIERSQLGQIIIDRGLLDGRLVNDRVNIATLQLEAADSTLNVRGSSGLTANAPVNILYAARTPDVKDLLALAKTRGSGALYINGFLSGARADLRTRGTMELTSFQTGTYSLRHMSSRYDLGLTGPGAPYGTVDANLSGVNAGTELRTVGLVVDVPRGLPHAVALRINVTDNAGRDDLIATHFTYRPKLIAGQLAQMHLDLPGGEWHLSAPVDYQQSLDGISISRMQLQSRAGELLMQGTLAFRGRQDFNLSLNRFDLAALQPLTTHLHDLRGTLSTNLRIAGTAEAPTLDLATQMSGLAVGKQPVGNVNATMNYAVERASFKLVLYQNVSDHLTAIGSMPASLNWSHGVKAKLGNNIALTVDSPRLSLAQLASLFPDEVRNFQGAAAINLRVQGALKQPQAAGTLRITGVQGQIVPLGIKVSQTEMIIDVNPREVRIETIEAHAGQGTIRGNGIIGLQQYAVSRLTANLTFDQWPAIDTQQYAATLGGHLSADGTLSHPQVQGQLEILNGTIQPDIAFLSATSNLAPDSTIEVIRPGQSLPARQNGAPVANPQHSPPTVQSSIFNNLAMKLALVIHRNTWIRHPDAVAELEGNLEVDKDPGGPIRVSGEVRTVRGWINYYNRQFTVKTGIFSFTGGHKIDPELDVDAQYQVTNYTIDIVVGGTASKPTLQLQSQPELAQADILSLILFGKTTDALGQGQQASLQQEATKMATGVAAQQIGQAVASSMGLQDMGITFNNSSNNSSSTSPSVGIGHYLGENTYVSASAPIGGRGQTLSVQYFLLSWLSITTTSAADGSHEIDLNVIKQY